MKKPYAFILSGFLLLSLSLYSCGTENTTGVDTEATEKEVDGRIDNEEDNEMMEDNDMMEDNTLPMDTTQNMETDTSMIEM